MTDPCKHQATLHDVAKLAQVSHQTVSRVINHSPNVSPLTRRKVLDAIEQLNYRPNRAARCLITGKSHTFQIIDFESTYVSPIPIIVSSAYGRGYRSGISILREHSLDALYVLLDELSSWMVDGIVLFGPQIRLDAEVLAQKCRGIPFVQMGGEMVPGIPGAAFDQQAGVQAVLDVLYRLGHRRIACIAGPQDTYDGRVRYETYLRWMESKGLAHGPVKVGTFFSEGGAALAEELLDEGGFSAVICGNDDSALGFEYIAQRRGVRIPQDISLAGFDDHVLAKFMNPPLTTVRQDYRLLSQTAIDLLVGLVNGGSSAQEHILLKPNVILRESVAARQS